MADEGDDIVQRVVLTGDKVILKQFQTIGAAGTKAFDDIGAAADDTSKTFGAVGAGFADTLTGLRGTGKAAEDAAAGLETANAKGISLAQTLRLLSRATGFRELGKLGGQARALGKAFEVALPAIVLATLGKLASGAAKAAQDFGDLQGELKVTTPQMADLQSTGNAAGLSFEELSSSMKGVDKLTKDTADGAKKNADAFGNLRNELNDTAIKSDDLNNQFSKLGRDSVQAGKDFSKTIRDIGQASIDSTKDFTTSLAKLQEQRNDIINGAPDAQTQRARQLRDLDAQEEALRDKQTKDIQNQLEQQIAATQKYNDAQIERANELRKLRNEEQANIQKEQELHRQLAQAAVDAAQNATALDKLGIAATDANGKLKKAPEVLLDIATALVKVSDPEKQLRIEQDLIAAGLDRKLLPALRRGADGYKALQAASKNINPGFTPEQIKSADSFAIALGQVGDAASALFKQAGIAIAPEFVGFFESLRDLLVEIRPGFVDFVKTLASLLTPALKLIADLVRTAVVPVFKLFFGALDQVASLINKAFGTNLTGMQLFLGTLISVFAVFRGGIIAIQAIVIGVGLVIKALDNAGINFKSVSKVASDAWNTIKSGATNAVTGVTTAWNGIAQFFTNLWTNLRAGATGIWNFITAIAGGAVQLIEDAWTGLIKFFADLWTQISDSANGVWTAVSNAANTSVQFIISIWTNIAQFFTTLWTAISSAANNGWIAVSNAAQSAADFVVGIFAGVRDKIIGYWTSIRDSILAVWDKVKDIVGKLSGPSGGGGGTTAGAGLKGGGHLRGPGSSTSDSIPIWGSNGEFMMNAKSVSKYGVAFMNAINSMRFDPDSFGFALGGLISFETSSPKLGFAEGGFIPEMGGRNTLNLTLDGQTVSTQVDDDNFEKLARTATRRSLRSAGRSQRWKR